MDANLSEFDKVAEMSGEMNQIKFLAASLLSLSIFALHVTAPQKYVVYIPAVEEDYKVRPAGFETPAPMVVSLEEADRRHKENNAWQINTSDFDKLERCYFNYCDLNLDLMLAKNFIVELFKG